ncbi:MAG: TonB-dependent receptor [Blastocatellia bacterium]|nr:TonB-dependent receptor [Blastocatellia bacterium]
MKSLFSGLSRIFLISCLILSSIFLAVADTTGRVSGKVINESGQAIKNALLILSSKDGITVSTVSNGNGEFSFSGVKKGSYYLKAEADGFKASVSDEIKLAEDSSRELDMTLRVGGISEEIIVTATTTTQTIDQLAKALTVTTREDIDNRKEYAVNEVLRSIPGVRLKIFGGPGGLTSIRFRGLFNENSLILIDGQRLRDAGDFRGSSQSISDSLFVNNVQQVEVLRGSGSTLYGTTAVGGVVNIVPYTGVGQPSGELMFEGGGLGFFRESARLGGSVKEKLYYGLGVSRTDTNNGIDGQDIFRDTTISSNVRFTPTAGISVSGVINYSRSFFNTNDSPFPIGPLGNEFGYATGNGPITGFIFDLNDPDSFRKTELFQGGLTLRHRVSDRVSYSASFNSVVSNRRFFDGPGADPLLVSLITKAQGFFPVSSSDTRFRGRTYTFNTAANVKLDSHNLLTVGFEAERERLRQVTDFFGRESFAQNTYGFYFQNQSAYFENRLQLSLSGRVQSFGLGIPESLTSIPSQDIERLREIGVPRSYTGDGAIAYSFFKTGTKIRAHVGNSFRAPSLSERFSAFDGTFRPVRVGNPFLRPERVISAEGGVDQSLLKDRLRLSMTYFYNRRQEIIAAGFVPFSSSAGAAFFQTNVAGGLSRGFELSVTANPLRGLDVTSSYLYVNSEIAFTGVRSDGSNIAGSTPSFSNPRNIFNLVINQRYKALNINFDLNAISEYDNPVFSPGELFTGFASPIFRFDGYVKADLTGSYTFKLGEKTKLELFAKVSNLFDQTYFEDGFQTPGVVATSGVKLKF